MSVSRLGEFALEERLPGAGSVFGAVHLQTSKRYALRVAPIRFGLSAAARAQFNDECTALKQLVHGNIVRCFGGVVADKHLYSVCEWADGESLQSTLDRRGQLAWEQIVEVAMEIAAAAAVAHEAGVFHDALIPEKVLLTPGGAQVIDFRLDRSGSNPLPCSSMSTGDRARYVAPERQAGAAASARTDIFSIGCLLYESLAGRPPYAGETAEQLAAEHQADRVPRLSEQLLELPFWLDKLVHQMIAVKPEDRPYSAAAVLHGLKEMQKHLAERTSAAAHAVGGLSGLRTTDEDKSEAKKVLGKKKERRRRKPEAEQSFYETAWFLGLCLVALVGLTVWLAWPPSDDKLFARAQSLLASGDPADAYRARRSYLAPLLKRFPDSPHAAEARAIADEMDMQSLVRKIENKLRLSRPMNSERERLLARALRMEQFGDRVSASEAYANMITMLDTSSEGEDRLYLLLAQKREQSLNAGDAESGNEDRRAYVVAKLDEADQLAANGDKPAAQRIWRSIESLYGNDRELKEEVQRATSRLLGDDSSDGESGSGGESDGGN